MISAAAIYAMLAVAPVAANSLYDFTMPNIDGKPTSLKKFKGKVVLVVNVASKCGLTPQYDALQKVYEANKDKGLVVLGFPANNFGGQEPGTEAEIKTFCSSKYNVTFPMFSKISVKGEDIHPLYKWLLEQTDNHNDIEWNFGKFLIGRDGSKVLRFSPRDTVESPNLKKAIETLLAEK
ncbi:MAG: glutathione peroxidase [Armatimonadota bacterium]